MRSILIGLIQLYRWFVSPLLGPNCRFHPTCSCYAQDALRRHGALARLLARRSAASGAATPGIPAVTIRSRTSCRPFRSDRLMDNPRLYLWIGLALLAWMNVVQWNRDYGAAARLPTASVCLPAAAAGGGQRRRTPRSCRP